MKSQINRTITILLAVCFLVSLTIGAASASRDSVLDSFTYKEKVNEAPPNNQHWGLGDDGEHGYSNRKNPKGIVDVSTSKFSSVVIRGDNVVY